MCNSKNHSPDCTCGFGGEGHRGRRTVYYSGWASQVAAQSAKRDVFLQRHPEFSRTQRAVACFVEPNAACPVCGRSVFYYQNEHGSRVFFDELGPPWPKHPCTDAPTRSFTSQSFRPLRLSPKWRTQSEIREIADWLAKQTSNFPGEPAKTRQRPAWPLVKIVKRVKSGSRVFLVLNPIAIEAGRMMFVSCKSLPKCCQPGELLAIRKSTISFFDTAAMAPKEIDVMKYRSPAAFLKALIAADPQSRG